MLTVEEHKRYSRHIILPEFGSSKQELLKSAKVLVIGAGGLGCPLLLYLAAAGVGHITIVDPDVVDLSNLQRQVLYEHGDIGQYKAAIAAQKLRKNNIHIQIVPVTESFQQHNCMDLLSGHDLVIDGSDNFATRYLVNDACVLSGKPFVFGSIFKFEGQVSVFNYQGGPTYRCLYPEPPSSDEVPSCSEIGVIGVLPGIVGMLQATEAIKVITGIGTPLSGKLLVYDALSNSQVIITVPKNNDIQITSLLDDYHAFCEPSSAPEYPNELSPQKALQLLQSQSCQIIDVREPWEYEICKIDGASLIPLKSIPQNLAAISYSQPKLVYCHHGVRSKSAIAFLESKGYKDLYNLEGGIDQWAVSLDLDMERY